MMPTPSVVQQKAEGRHPSLLPNFASLLLETEIELESHPSPQALESLVGLYAQAIEYYEYIGNPVFSDFKQRMQQILVKPETLKLLNTPNDRKKPKRTRAALAAEFSKQLSERTPVIVRTDVRGQKAASKALTDVLSQENNLQRRLLMRRQQGALTARFDSDDDDPLWDLEKKIEETMENSFRAKAEEVTELRVQHVVALAQCEGLSPQSKVRMAAELELRIQKVSERYDSARRESVKTLREQYKL